MKTKGPAAPERPPPPRAPGEPIGLSLEGRSLYVVGVVKGLRSEGERMTRLVASLSPDAIAVSIAPEEVGGLRAYDGGELGMSGVEETYATHLSKWGEVSLPPPPYLELVKCGGKLRIPVHGIDFDEETYSSLYVEHVTGMRMIAASFKEARLKDRKFKAKDQFEFAAEWDAAVNSTKGHRELERAREKRMAEEVARLAGKHERLLVAVEYERERGILDNLGRKGATELREF